MASDPDLRQFEVLREELSAVSQLEIVLERISWGSVASYGLRPTEMERGRGFAIGISRSLHSVEALLVTDSFAGDLVRGIGERVAYEPQAWLDLESDAAAAGVSIYVVVNDEYQPALDALPMEPWRALEIECRRRVGRGESGGGCLSGGGGSYMFVDGAGGGGCGFGRDR